MSVPPVSASINSALANAAVTPSVSVPLATVEALLNQWDEVSFNYRKSPGLSKFIGLAFDACATDLRRVLDLAATDKSSDVGPH